MILRNLRTNQPENPGRWRQLPERAISALIIKALSVFNDSESLLQSLMALSCDCLGVGGIIVIKLVRTWIKKKSEHKYFPRQHRVSNP